MENFFDQFDEEEVSQAQPQGNFFDQFDEEVSSPANTPAPEGATYTGIQVPQGDLPAGFQPNDQLRDRTIADSSMYSNVQTEEEAQARYQAALRNPENKNRVVPYPEKTWFGSDEYDVGLGQQVAGGLINAGKETAKTIAGAGGLLINKGAELIGSDYRNRGAEAVDQNIREYVPVGTSDQLVNDMTGAVVGTVGGMGAGRALTGGLTKAASGGTNTITERILNFLGLEAAGSTGAAITAGEDTGTLIVGNESLGSLNPGFEPSKDNTYAENLIGKKANIAADNLLLSGPAVGLAKALGITTKVVKDKIGTPIAGIFSQKVADNEVVDIMVNNTFGNELDPLAKAQFVRETQQMVNQNKDVTLSINGKETYVTLDPMTAAERGYRAKAENPNLTPDQREEAIKIADRLGLQRDAIFNQNYLEPQGKTSEYRIGAEKYASDVYNESGGAQSVENARKGIVRSGQEEVGEAMAKESVASDELIQLRADITDRLSNDPLFGQQLQDLGNSAGINVFGGQRQTLDQIVEKVVELRGSMKDEQRKLYDALPDDILVEGSELAPVLGNLNERARRALSENLRGIIDMKNNDEATVIDSLYQMPFKKLHNEVLPNLSRTISRYLKSTNPDDLAAADQLIALKKEITVSQPATLGAEVDPKTSAKFIKALDDINKFNTKYYGYFGDGTLKEVSDLNKSVRPGIASSEAKFLDDSRSVMKDAFTERNKETGGLIVDLLNTQGNGGLVKDYIVGRAAQRIADTVRTEGMDAVNFDQFAQQLRQESGVLYEKFPQEAQQIDTFVNELKDLQKTNIPEFEKRLADAQLNADNVREQVLDKELRDFFGRQGEELVEGQPIFRKMLESDQPNQLISMMERADASPNPEVIREGMLAALGKELQVDPTWVANNREKFENYIQIIAPNNTEVQEGTKAFFDLIQDTEIGRGPENLAGRVPARVQQEGQDAISKVITGSIGIMNRLSATVRAGSRTLVANVDPKQRAINALGRFYADPQEFMRLGNQYVEAQQKGVGVQEAFNNFARYLTRGVNTVSDGPPDLPPTDDLEAIQNDTQPSTGGVLDPQGIPLDGPPDMPPVRLPEAPQNYPDNLEDMPSGSSVPKSPEPPPIEKLRPFSADEYRQNDDGTNSTELEVTIQDENGKWMNVPSLWNSDTGWIELNEDDSRTVAKSYEQRTGVEFPRFNSLEEAEEFARNRSSKGGTAVGPLQNLPGQNRNSKQFDAIMEF